jgi:hypothetical protein
MSEPRIKFTFGGQELEGTRENTYLYTFMGELACYDHVFIVSTEDDGSNSGHYLWNSNSTFNEVAEYMLDKEFTVHLNLPNISDMDREVFEEFHYKDIRSSNFPPDWE